MTVVQSVTAPLTLEGVQWMPLAIVSGIVLRGLLMHKLIGGAVLTHSKWRQTVSIPQTQSHLFCCTNPIQRHYTMRCGETLFELESVLPLER